jgi:hypothetical protein
MLTICKPEANYFAKKQQPGLDSGATFAGNVSVCCENARAGGNEADCSYLRQR